MTEKKDRLRTLGDDTGRDPGEREPKEPAGSEALRAKTRETLTEEFQRALMMKEKLWAEASIGGKEKGRESLRRTEKIRGLVAALEGMNRLALQLGLITPAESRELYADAMKRGLYEGWK